MTSSAPPSNDPPIQRRVRWRHTRPMLIWISLMAAWMVLIFIGSTGLMTPNHTGSMLHRLLAVFSIQLDPLIEGHWNHIVRKCGHVCEYSILALLAARVFLGSTYAGLRRWWWVWSIMVVIAFASSDEFHQTFIPGREGQVKDVVLDSAGGAAALALLAIARSAWFASRSKTADKESI